MRLYITYKRPPTAAKPLLWRKNRRHHTHTLTFVSVCLWHGCPTSLYTEPTLQSSVHFFCRDLCFCGQQEEMDIFPSVERLAFLSLQALIFPNDVSPRDVIHHHDQNSSEELWLGPTARDTRRSICFATYHVLDLGTDSGGCVVDLLIIDLVEISPAYRNLPSAFFKCYGETPAASRFVERDAEGRRSC